MGNTAADYLIKCTKMDPVPNKLDTMKIADSKYVDNHNEGAKVSGSKDPWNDENLDTNLNLTSTFANNGTAQSEAMMSSARSNDSKSRK